MATVISPVRQYIDKQLEIKGELLARFYSDAIQHGMDRGEASDAFNSAMNAEIDRYLSDIMADVPAYLVTMAADVQKNGIAYDIMGWK